MRDTTVPYLSLEHPIRFAHRGSTVLWPENTMEAFHGAVGLGCRYIETDVQMTSDEVVVVFHDPTLQRTTGGTGKVAETTYAEVKRLDAGFNFDPDGGYRMRARGVNVSSLHEILDAFPDTHFNIDIKGRGMERGVYQVVRDAGRLDSVLIGAFSDRRLAKFRRVSGGAVATSAGPSAAVAMWTAGRFGRPAKRRAVAYQVPHDHKMLPLDRKYVEAIHKSGAQVHAWTVNTVEEMDRVLDLGVDGVVTDRLDLLNQVVARRAQSF